VKRLLAKPKRSKSLFDCIDLRPKRLQPEMDGTGAVFEGGNWTYINGKVIAATLPPVPEPASIFLLTIGMLPVGVAYRRRIRGGYLRTLYEGKIARTSSTSSMRG
jgi:hypothetical protein